LPYFKSSKLRIHIANSRYKMKDIQGIILAHVLSDHIQAANGNFSDAFLASND
jgi:hypothetical protein